MLASNTEACRASAAACRNQLQVPMNGKESSLLIHSAKELTSSISPALHISSLLRITLSSDAFLDYVPRNVSSEGDIFFFSSLIVCCSSCLQTVVCGLEGGISFPPSKGNGQGMVPSAPHGQFPLPSRHRRSRASFYVLLAPA